MISIPKISVVMPVHNAEPFIEKAIDSILNQSFCNFEFIIIDGCSTDDSYKIIQKYERIDDRIISLRKNMDLIDTLNLSIKISRGKYIARMDADDISMPDRLMKQFNYMEINPDIGISGGTMQIINETGNIIRKREYHLKDEDIRRNIFRYSPFSHPTIIMRRDILNKAGFYDHKYRHAEDYELYFRIGKLSKFGNLPDVLIQYRLHNNSVTISKIQEMERNTLEIRKKYSKEHGYYMPMLDKICNLIIRQSKYFIPYKLKIELFNFLRDTKK